MKLSKDDALARAKVVVGLGVSAALAIVTENTCDLGHAIAAIERTLHELKAFHAPRAGWMLPSHDDEELGSEG